MPQSYSNQLQLQSQLSGSGNLQAPLKQPLSDQFKQQRQQPLSKQFTQQMTQQSTGDRELVQVYDSIYEWDWNPDSWQWDLFLRHIDLELDDNYNLVGSTAQLWTGNSWQNYVLTSTSVTDNGLTITSTQQLWINNEYVNSQRMITQLMNPTDFNTTVTIQNWTNGAWENEYRWILLYSEEGLELSETDQVWLDGAWTNSTRYQYLYSGTGSNVNMSEMLIQEWMDPAWNDVIRYSMTYYPDNTMSGQLEEFYLENMWVNSTKDTLFTYNGQGSMTSYTRYIWTGEDWMNMYKIENTYDTHNNLTSNSVFQWMNLWTMISQEISNYTYDANDFIMGESVLNVKMDGPMGGFSSGDSTNYVYHTVITGNGQVSLEEDGIAVWPNPGKDVFNISSNELIRQTEVFDLSGHRLRMLQSVGQSANSIDLTDSPKGVYILRLQTDSGIYHRKVIKQ